MTLIRYGQCATVAIGPADYPLGRGIPPESLRNLGLPAALHEFAASAGRDETAVVFSGAAGVPGHPEMWRWADFEVAPEVDAAIRAADRGANGPYWPRFRLGKNQ